MQYLLPASSATGVAQPTMQESISFQTRVAAGFLWRCWVLPPKDWDTTHTDAMVSETMTGREEYESQACQVCNSTILYATEVVTRRGFLHLVLVKVPRATSVWRQEMVG